jgi:hypothetical protein
MSPAYEQFNIQLASSIGMPPKKTEADPGLHGPAGAGMHGMGVRTPRAAAVAAATAGFARLIQTPKEGTFSIGMISVILPACMGPPTTGGGRKVNVPGAAPIVHTAIAPVVTTGPAICFPVPVSIDVYRMMLCQKSKENEKSNPSIFLI